jgi:hypothetical protein
LKQLQECETRWNSTFQMLARFLELGTHVSGILLNYRKPKMLIHDEMEILKDIVEILRPFESITKEICGDKYVTCSKIILIVHCVYLTLSKIEGGTPMGRELKKNLFNEVNKRCFIQLTLKVTFLVEANLIKNCSL